MMSAVIFAASAVGCLFALNNGMRAVAGRAREPRHRHLLQVRKPGLARWIDAVPCSTTM